jgi:hypothetical protein
MKFLFLIISVSFFSISLVGCAQSGSDTPSLAGNMPNTSRLPAPDAYQRNSAIDSSTMIAPSRP